MSWRKAFTPIFYAVFNIIGIALISIIIDSLLKSNNSNGEIWLFTGFILAFLISGTLFSFYAAAMACIQKDIPEDDSTVKKKGRTCAEWFYIILHMSFSAVVIAMSAIIISNPEEVSYGSYIFSACVLGLSAAALSLLLGIFIWRVVKYCRKGTATIDQNEITLHT